MHFDLASLPEGTKEAWLRVHTARLLASYRRWTGQNLIPPTVAPEEQVQALFEAPFAVVSHNTATDPIFNYGNRTALTLFEISWEEFTALPSRLSAEPVHRDERARLMQQVTEQGYISDYRGVRISKQGRRFWIENAIVWNLHDESGAYCGQAATFRDWRFLPASPSAEK